MSAAVVKLPTAARRQVKQPCNKWSREAKRAMREAQPVRFDYRPPWRREAEAIARAIYPMTPERWLMVAMLHAMPAEAFEKLTAFAVHGQPAIRGMMQLAKGGTGLSLAVMDALERIGQ